MKTFKHITPYTSYNWKTYQFWRVTWKTDIECFFRLYNATFKELL